MDCSEVVPIAIRFHVGIILVSQATTRDDDNNDKVKKVVFCAKTALNLQTLFIYFFDVTCTTTKSPNATFYGGREHATTNSPFSF